MNTLGERLAEMAKPRGTCIIGGIVTLSLGSTGAGDRGWELRVTAEDAQGVKQKRLEELLGRASVKAVREVALSLLVHSTSLECLAS